MATEYWQSPSGTTLDFDTDTGAAEIALREQAGWVRVNKTEAAPALKAHEQSQAEVAAVFHQNIAAKAKGLGQE